MRKFLLTRLGIMIVALLLYSGVYCQAIQSATIEAGIVKQYKRVDFEVVLTAPFTNPHDARSISLDFIANTPDGKIVQLPCYFVSGTPGRSVWKARFAPQKTGKYTYYFQLSTNNKKVVATKKAKFVSMQSSSDGFLHTHDNFWTLTFDSGKPFRGIGENIGWESRSFEDPKWTYDYLLPTLSSNGANFFRTWMCVWNLPVAWNKVNDTNRYKNSPNYFNEYGVERMDELVRMCDSLGLYFMLSIDAHGALIPGAYWEFNSHNKANGGPAATPTEFFTNAESRAMYKNRLRYLVARWGYSPSIAAWEFFNEIDNATFTATPQDSVLIAHDIITNWHDEMSTYLKKTDPFRHIVTTSISHRDIKGMNNLSNIDLNQKHIYNKTHLLSPTIHEYVTRFKKPYVIGEFGYDWNWDNVKHEFGPGFDYDYKRGLWYGLFSPTPILPMTWWWEFFDERKMTPYFKSVREINDKMLTAGKGTFEMANASANGLEVYAVRCGATYFVYVLNGSSSSPGSSLNIALDGADQFDVTSYIPADQNYSRLATIRKGDTVELKKLAMQEEIILILSPAGSPAAITE